MADFRYGVFRSPDEPGGRVGVVVGSSVIDLAALGLDVPSELFAQPSLNPFLAAGSATWDAVREQVYNRLAAGDVASRPLTEVEPLQPFQPGDYVDFYSSIEHATNLGRLFRPDGDPLLPNWRHLPVGYHGRSATVVVSGTPIRRPHGQLGPGRFGPTEQLDIELEVGFVVGGPASSLGEPIPVEEAERHIFGLVLVNDWSARDIQRWEYQPLGPFLGKSFATSISPWVVPLVELRSRRVDGPVQDPAPLPYLRAAEPRNLDLQLEVELNGEVISRTGTAGLYWSMAQQLAHATVNGAVVRPGDLFASGTISGSTPGTEGSLIELGRPFLADGDSVVLRSAQRGECEGTNYAAAVTG
ncbi:MAG: fumarylacetoacetate hydrolase family protein [Actinomycetota bacterium]